MEYKNTLEIVSEHLQEVNEMISNFYNLKKIPAIEMDLALSKIRNLYDVLLMIKHSETQRLALETEHKSETAGKGITQEKSQASENIELELENIKEQNPVKEEEVAKTTSEHISKPLQDSEPRIISDRFKSKSTSINENLGKTAYRKDLSSQLQSKPISNIANAIGLNDKFLIIKTLFNGNADQYNETLLMLNSASNFNEAFNYLVENFDWDMDSEIVQKLLELIRRKLIISKNE
ncbi:MAG: hypothetical protein JXJ22_08905 [Bacteroidales bacterium]|nr:hypothetical protein [Bacteroidales bacterium]